MHRILLATLSGIAIGGLAALLLSASAGGAAAHPKSIRIRAQAKGGAVDPSKGKSKRKTAKAVHTKPKRRPCPFRRDIDGWHSIKGSHRYVVLTTGLQYYLLSLSPGCRDLNFNESIAIKSRPSAGLCITKGDVIYSRNHNLCFITGIQQVKNYPEAEAIVAARKKQKAR